MSETEVKSRVIVGNEYKYREKLERVTENYTGYIDIIENEMLRNDELMLRDWFNNSQIKWVGNFDEASVLYGLDNLVVTHEFSTMHKDDMHFKLPIMNMTLYWAPWCPHCKKVLPIVNRVPFTTYFTYLTMINIDDHPAPDVSGVPTFVFENSRIIGSRQSDEEYVDELLKILSWNEGKDWGEDEFGQ